MSAFPGQVDAVPRIRTLLDGLDALAQGKQRDRQLIMREFGTFFGVQVELSGGPLSPGSPDNRDTSEMFPAVGLEWDSRTSGDWALENNQLTASIRTASSWRSLCAAQSLPMDRTSYFTVSVHEMRTMAVGIVSGELPPNYCGETAESWGYQSTGHFLHNGVIRDDNEEARPTGQTFVGGDTIGVLYDPAAELICFYKNGKLAGMPLLEVRPKEDGGGMKLCVSIYLGPASFSVDPAPHGDDPASGATMVPVFMRSHE